MRNRLLTDRPLDLCAAATLFAGSDCGAQVAGLPSVNRETTYFEVARVAVRTAFEQLGPRSQGAFLVQRGQRYDVDSVLSLYESLTRHTVNP